MTRRDLLGLIASFALGKNSMPVPYDVSDGKALFYYLPTLWSKSSTCGPFEHNGKLYLVTYTRITGAFGFRTYYIVVYVSSDAGATWVEADSADRIALYDDTRSIGVCRDSNYIWISAEWSNAAPPEIRIYRFDMDTDQWSGILDSFNKSDYATGLGCLICKLTSGVFVITYTDFENVGGTDYQRVKWRTYTYGVGFGSEVLLAAGEAYDFFLHSAIVGASDITHVFMQRGNPNMDGLYHQSVSSGGVKGSLHLVKASGSDEYEQAGTPVAYTSGSDVNIAFPYLKYSSPYSVRCFHATSATNPTWTDEQVSDKDGPLRSLEAWRTAVVFNNELYVLWSTFYLDPITGYQWGVFWSKRSGGTWTDAAWARDIAAFGESSDVGYLTAYPGVSGIHFAWEVGTYDTVYYDFLTFGADCAFWGTGAGSRIGASNYGFFV